MVYAVSRKTALGLEARNKKDYINCLQDSCYGLPSLPIYIGVWSGARRLVFGLFAH
jgi:hypothetical protein